MSLDLEKAESHPLGGTAELLEYFRKAERTGSERRIGLEHEKLIYTREGQPVPYEGPNGIGALLGRLAERGHAPYREEAGGPMIALMREGVTVSLEPGGQFELSGAPHRTARAAHEENLVHLSQVKEAGEALGLFPVALGYRPYGTPAQMPWMPKHRYQAMREVLPRRGGYALDMMLMTATGQVSLDWTDEADCARKVTLATRLNPVLVALYANSPLVDGRPSGFLSFRSQLWTDVDKARCGVFPAMLDGRFSYAAYVDWALDAPLLFLRREGRYLTPKLTFRELLARGHEGSPATDSDWTDHLSTLFPEVRLKKVIEIRGADCVDAGMTGALAALFRALFYDAGALEEALAAVPAPSMAGYEAGMEEARRRGLRGSYEGRPLGRLAREVLGIAREGLGRLDPLDAPLLDPLFEVAEAGRSVAEQVLEAFEQDPAPARLLAKFAL